MTPGKLASLRAKAEAATGDPSEDCSGCEYGYHSGCVYCTGLQRKAKAEYIAEADPETVLALLDEIERLRGPRRVRRYE